MNKLAATALGGLLFGLGLGLFSNVSGLVLALYGMVIGMLLGALVVQHRHGRS